jgi:predicted metalloprotease with PDZ domain
MQYTISYSDPQKHYIDIEVVVENIATPYIEIQLPAWRPGRYELANFAKNMTRLTAVDGKGTKLAVQKLTKDRWKVSTENTAAIKINYSYYAQQMDAGGSWLDENQLYINFINCLIYIEGRITEECYVHLQLPEQYQIACGMGEVTTRTLYASDYYQLVDSPVIASASLQHYSYQLASTTFHIWIQGNCELDWQQVMNDFKEFSKVQMQMMHGFPCQHYHFLFHWLSYQHYHGVEHQNSTVITLGPASQAKLLYSELLGISSHELFHTWNVIRIRPKELLPYDFTKENYFTTGFVAEGITTYYGDLFLLRSGIFTLEIYLQELSKTLNKHFMNSNQSSLSLTESSFDLWLDGYTMGAPGRKVSIYNKGTLAAFILDLEIRQFTNHAKSLDDVMLYLWQHYGEKEIGYIKEDYQAAVEFIIGQPYQPYFEACIEGTNPLEERLANALTYIGCELNIIKRLPGSANIEITIQVSPDSNEMQMKSLQKWAER